MFVCVCVFWIRKKGTILSVSPTHRDEILFGNKKRERERSWEGVKRKEYLYIEMCGCVLRGKEILRTKEKCKEGKNRFYKTISFPVGRKKGRKERS